MSTEVVAVDEVTLAELGKELCATVEIDGICRHCGAPAGLLRDRLGGHVMHLHPRCDGWQAAVDTAKMTGISPAEMARGHVLVDKPS